MEQLYRQLADILETAEVDRESVLDEFEQWDSLAALSLCAAVMSNFGVTLGGEDLGRAKTAGEIEDLIATRLKA